MSERCPRCGSRATGTSPRRGHDCVNVLIDRLAKAERQRDEARDALRRIVSPSDGRVVLIVDTIEGCTSCGETFTAAEQRAFDPADNDHCPKCNDRGSLTTYYGDPEHQIREHDLGDPRDIFVRAATKEPT